MATIWNIRGTNGSGKTTLAKAFLPPGYQTQSPVDLSSYDAPTKKDPGRRLRYPGYLHEGVLVLGKYDDGCGGMDRHPAGKGFEVPQAAIWHGLGRGAPDCFQGTVTDVICEGVLASAVYGSWNDFAQALADEHHLFAFVYLHTNLDTCLERIQQRREAAGSPRKTGADWDRMVLNVKGKWDGTMATRRKAIEGKHIVFDLPLGHELQVMKHLVAVGPSASEAQQYRAHA